jgi:retron-type reverse transcriptase
VAQAVDAGSGSVAPAVFTQYATALLTRGLPVLFSVEHLAFVLGLQAYELATIADTPSRNYTRFRIAKRRGGSRLIEAPTKRLKYVQRWIQTQVTSRLPLSDSAHGFREGRSIRTNATPHLGSRILVQYDVEDFFGSVRTSAVRRAFRDLGYSSELGHVLAQLCTIRDALPQGAPTSPDLANYAFCAIDQSLEKLSRQHEMRYTRYADDLTFSGPGAEQSAVRRSIEDVIQDAGFRLNREKTRRVSRGMRQRVTGVVVNEKLNWPRDKRRWLRQELYYLEKHGVETHLRVRGSTHARYREYIYGHVYALNVIRPDEAESMLRRLDAVAWPATLTPPSGRDGPRGTEQGPGTRSDGGGE